jgi:hypothetical protein
MKTKYSSMFGLLAVLLLVASFIVPAKLASPTSVEASADSTLRWAILDTPNSLPNNFKEVYNGAGLMGAELNKLVVTSAGNLMYMVATGFGPLGGPFDILWFTPDGGVDWMPSVTKNLQRDLGANWLNFFPVYDVAAAPDDPRVVAVVLDDGLDGPAGGPQEVWVSTDGGSSWADTNIGNILRTSNLLISCIDISMDYGGKRDIAVGTRNGAVAPAGVVWSNPVANGQAKVLTAQMKGFGSWNLQDATGTPASSDWPGDAALLDVEDVKFSPSYNGDSTLTLVYSTFPAVGTGGTFFLTGVRDLDRNSTAWSQFPVEVKDPTSAVLASPNAVEVADVCLQLPSDFSGQAASLRRAYVSFWASPKCPATGPLAGANLDGAETGIYRIDDTVVYELMDCTTPLAKNIKNIAYFGTYASGKLLAGEVYGDECWATVPTWFTDSPTTCPIPCWYPCKKCPTGAAGDCDYDNGNAQVAWSPDGNTAYAITSSAISGPYYDATIGLPNVWPFGILHTEVYDESAFSLSRNNGETWNQLAMIDTRIDKLTDVAPAADCSTLYLASTNLGVDCKCKAYVTANVTCCYDPSGSGTCQIDFPYSPSADCGTYIADTLDTTGTTCTYNLAKCACDYTVAASAQFHCNCTTCTTCNVTVTFTPYSSSVTSDNSSGQVCVTEWVTLMGDLDCCTQTGCEERGECVGFDSVWRTSTNEAVTSPLPALPLGNIWERVLCRHTATDCDLPESEYAILRLAPDKTDGQILFWGAGGADGDMMGCQFQAGANTRAVAWTPDYGDYWANINPRVAVQDMAAESSTILYILDASGLVQRMPYTGTAWSSAITNGDTWLSAAHTIAVHPEGKVLVGAAADAEFAGFQASFSSDSAASFIPASSAFAPDYGRRHVIFDTNYNDNSIFFMGVDNFANTGEETIWRNTVFPFGAWEDMLTASTTYHTNGYFGLAVPYTGDALYGAHLAAREDSGNWCTVERTIYRYAGIPKPNIPWDHLDIGTDGYGSTAIGHTYPDFTLEPSSLKMCGCLTMDTDTVLYAIDDCNYSMPFNIGICQNPYYCVGDSTTWPYRSTGMLWRYTDCLAKKGPVLTGPENGGLIGCDPVSGRNQEINLTWEQLCLATNYDIEVSKDENFTIKMIDVTSAPITDYTFRPEDVTSPAAFIPAGATSLPWEGYTSAVGWSTPFECGHKYFWHIQVRGDAWGGFIRSPWSETRNFTIKAGLPVTTPYFGPQLLSPNNGCLGCPVKPVSFSWSPFKETTKYKFVLAKDAAMTQVVTEAETSTTAFEYDGTLDYSTNYFWRVMSLEPAPSDWSATFSFQTEAAPAPAPAPAPPSPTPMWVWIVIAIGAILVIVTLVLIFKTRRV